MNHTILDHLKENLHTQVCKYAGMEVCMQVCNYETMQVSKYARGI